MIAKLVEENNVEIYQEVNTKKGSKLEYVTTFCSPNKKCAYALIASLKLYTIDFDTISSGN